MKQARFFQQKDGAVVCSLCHHHCRIKPGRRGLCGVRENRDSILYSLVYGEVSAEHIDPVEKKPLFHFLPDTLTYSVATAGCNFTCLHCQNYSLSQVGAGGPRSSGRAPRLPQEVAASAVAGGCRSISYTYSEPTVFFEFAYDCCLEARKRGLKNVFVSNGYMSREAAVELAPVLDAINIDVKAFSEDFYRRICGASLQPVLDNVSFFKESGVWVEVTTLVIPGLNDSDEELRAIAEFLVGCAPDIPWHVSGFHPTYHLLDRPPTPPERLHTARQIGREAGLSYVYVGNIRGGSGEDTECPACGANLIRRRGFSIIENRLSSGTCPDCSAAIAGLWD